MKIYFDTGSLVDKLESVIVDLDGITVRDLDVKSYRKRTLMGEHTLNLYFSLPEYIEIPVGAYCIYPEIQSGEKPEDFIDTDRFYEINNPSEFKKNGTEHYEYTLVLESHQSKLEKYKIREVSGKRLKFPITATPKEFLTLIIANLNSREAGWKVGRFLDAPETLVSFNHNTCMEALEMVAEAFETEWEIENKTIHLGKVEYFHDNPLPLSYGRGNGFLPGIGRAKFDNTKPIEVLFVQGGDRNIDINEYGSAELLLPANTIIGYDGERFYSSEFIPPAGSNPIWYVVDNEGLSIKRWDRPKRTGVEDSLDLSDIYPSYFGEVTAVYEVDEEKHFWDIIDNNIPLRLDFSNCRMDGETAVIAFQSGMLAGRELKIEQSATRLSGYVHQERRWKLQPELQDGITMPDRATGYFPRIGDKYAVYGIKMPMEYITDREIGASWKMLREAVRYLYDNEKQKFSFVGDIQGKWARDNWTNELNVGGKLKIGGYVNFTDEHFASEGILIRQVSITDFLHKPYQPKVELSNDPLSRGFVSELRKLDQNEVVTEDNFRQAKNFSRRNYQSAVEAITMLEKLEWGHFTESISPMSIRAMTALLGDESLQFRFVNPVDGKIDPEFHIYWDSVGMQIKTTKNIVLEHLTMGIATLSTDEALREWDTQYMAWDIPEYSSGTLEDENKAYFLYAKVNRWGDSTGVMLLSEEAMKMDDEEEYYYLLVGIVSSLIDGVRSFEALYGFTEIGPGRMTINLIKSADGKTYFDLERGEIGGVIKFITSSQEVEELSNVADILNTKGRIFYNTPVPPYSLNDLWVNGSTLRICTNAKSKGQTYAAADWSAGVNYDNTVTTINGGIVTTGTIRVQNLLGAVVAGITGNGTAGTSIKIWAGSTYEQRASAPYRVQQNGKMIATDADITGKVSASSGTIGGFEIGSNRIGVAGDLTTSRYHGFGMYMDYIKYTNANVWAGIGMNVSASTLLSMARFEYNGSSQSHNSGIGVNVIFRPYVQFNNSIQRALQVDGNTVMLGGNAFYDDSHFGEAHEDTITSRINFTHQFILTVSDGGFWTVYLPNSTQAISAATINGKVRSVSFLLHVTINHSSTGKIRLAGVSGGVLRNNNGNIWNGNSSFANGYVDMEKGDCLILRYYNGNYYRVSYQD